MRIPSRRALILSSALALGALAQERGRLIGVEAGGDAAASSIDLIGDRPLSFTTLKLHEPPRVVVDFADTELAGIAKELSVEDGTVRRVAAAVAGQRTARVVIELTAEAEFDIRAQGNRVQVRVPRLAAAQGPAIAKESPEARKAREQAEKRERAAAAQQAARNRRIAAADKAAADQRARAERAVAGKRAREEKAAADRRAGEEKAAAGKRAREEKAAAERQARADKAAAAGKARLLAKADAAERKRTAQAAKAQAKSAPKQRPLAMAGARHAITGIGFRPIGAGEVIVRSDQPLEYDVSGDGDAVLLHLPRAAIPVANNRRPLDTRFFNGPVLRVVPLPVADGTDVRIELRGHADYQLAQSGTVLTVTFSAPR